MNWALSSALAASVAAATFACSSRSPAAAAKQDAAPPNPLAQAAVLYPNFQALHSGVVVGACASTSGACHDSEQFPDLYTPESLLATINERCNASTADPLQIHDLCEPAGDVLLVKGGPDQGWMSRVGFVTDHTSDPEATIVLTLHDPTPHDAQNVPASIVRRFDASNAREIPLGFVLSTQAGQSQAILSADDLLPELVDFFTSTFTPGLAEQVVLGDPNRNGVFGADLGGALIKPGDLDRSFLIERILGIVPPQMPLANADLSAVQIAALECWVLQLLPDGSNADGPIDYSECPTNLPQPEPQPPDP